MNAPSRYHLFQGYGIELEYMLVNKDTLDVAPITDELLKYELGEFGSDFENGIVTWSNELVLHVVELKSTKPESNFNSMEYGFAENITRINNILTQWNTMLMPTAAHPWMNPLTETKLWPHDSNEVYEIYDRIFNSKGHGWSNLQSTHLNLPFYDDEEFAKLHAAVRLVLPLLPALCASSPILDGKSTGMLDARLSFYKTNQAKIPSITGKVIPEAIFSKRNYINMIYEKIKSDISIHDPDQILNPVWVNSRGAIPRFDRGSIEIRVMDIQECPAADLAIISLVIEWLKSLVQEKIISHEDQMKYKTEMLVHIFDQVIISGQDTIIENPEYLKMAKLSNPCTAREFWQALIELLSELNSLIENSKPELLLILKEGTLSDRILRAVGNDFSQSSLSRIYRQLSVCLGQNKMFIP